MYYSNLSWEGAAKEACADEKKARKYQALWEEKKKKKAMNNSL